MRISDWSSDVCSSDLVDVEALSFRQLVRRPALEHVEPFSIGLHQTVFDAVVDHLDEMARAGRTDVDVALLGTRTLNFLARGGARDCAQPRRERIEDRIQMVEIGRASCRERVCPYV